MTPSRILVSRGSLKGHTKAIPMIGPSELAACLDSTSEGFPGSIVTKTMHLSCSNDRCLACGLVVKLKILEIWCGNGGTNGKNPKS